MTYRESFIKSKRLESAIGMILLALLSIALCGFAFGITEGLKMLFGVITE